MMSYRPAVAAVPHKESYRWNRHWIEARAKTDWPEFMVNVCHSLSGKILASRHSLPFLRPMRVWLAVLFVVSVARAAVPAELAEALKTFRSDPPPGWSYTLTTAGEGRSTVERCDASKPEFERWSLLMKDGRQPTPAESSEYFEARSRRSRGGTGPKVTDQLDLDTLQQLSATDEEITYTCRVKQGAADDNVSP